MEYAEWALLVDDVYEAFGQKPPRPETVRRLWDRETQLVSSFPSSRLDEALQTLTRDDSRNRIAPRDILNTLRTLTKHRPHSSNGARLVNYDADGDIEWQLLRDAKTESARTGEPWHDILTRRRHNPDPPSTEAAQWIADIRDYLARKLALDEGDTACP